MAAYSCSELIYRIFSSRNLAHLEHWKTDSYAAHKALGHFYEDIVSNIDSFIEAYQGAFSKVDIKIDEKLEDGLESRTDILLSLQDDVKWINKNRTELAGKVPCLENILDELTDTYLSTIYKLRFLS